MPAKAVLGGISNSEGVISSRRLPRISMDAGTANPFASRPVEKEVSTGRGTSDVDYYCREYAKWLNLNFVAVLN
jgi:hypothetical protein